MDRRAAGDLAVAEDLGADLADLAVADLTDLAPDLGPDLAPDLVVATPPSCAGLPGCGQESCCASPLVRLRISSLNPKDSATGNRASMVKYGVPSRRDSERMEPRRRVRTA